MGARLQKLSSDASCSSSDALKELLQAQCFIIVERVFGDAQICAAAAKEAQALQSAGHFKSAGFHNGEGQRVTDALSRGDAILWLHAEELMALPALQRVAAMFERLLERLNATLRQLQQDMQLEAKEMQLAVYSGGSSGYTPHKDCGKMAGRDRYVTIIIFLNEQWQTDWGGDLRLHLPDCLLDVSPVANRMVIFRSDVLEHSVRPIKENNRFALTCWLSARRSSS